MFLKTLILFAVVINLSIGSPLLGSLKQRRYNDEPIYENNPFNDFFIQILEEFRLRMHMDMTETMGVPRLDPFEMDEFEIDGSEDSFIPLMSGFDIKFDTIKVVGLNKFVLNFINVELPSFDFAFDMTLPELTVTGNYEADGVTDYFSMKGEGPFSLTIYGINMKISGNMGPEDETAIDMSLSHLKIHFSIADMEGQFEGLEKKSQFFNDIINNVVPELVDAMWPDIEPMVVEMVEEMSGDMMKDLTFTGIEDMFPPIEPLEP